MVRAATSRSMDFREFDFTRRAWLRLEIICQQLESEYLLRLLEYRALGDESAILQQYKAAIVPWIAKDGGQTPEQTTDALARWYLTFAPHKVLRG